MRFHPRWTVWPDTIKLKPDTVEFDPTIELFWASINPATSLCVQKPCSTFSVLHDELTVLPVSYTSYIPFKAEAKRSEKVRLHESESMVCRSQILIVFPCPSPPPSGSGKRLWSERFEGYWVFQLNAALWSHASSRAGTVLLWIYKGHLISTRLEDATSQNTKRNANSVATPSPVFSYSWTYACCIRCPKALSWWMITHFHVPIRHRCTSFSSCYRVVVFLLRKFRNNFIFSFPSSTSPDCLNGSYLFVWSLNQFLLCCCLCCSFRRSFLPANWLHRHRHYSSQFVHLPCMRNRQHSHVLRERFNEVNRNLQRLQTHPIHYHLQNIPI